MLKAIFRDKNSTEILVASLFSFLALFFYFPFLMAVLVLFAATIFALIGKNNRWFLLLVVVLMTFVIGVYVASKSDYFVIGNDKYQYINYLELFRSGGFFDLVAMHPEFVSFGFLNILSFFESDNFVFFIYYCFSFLVLCSSFLNYERVLPLFIFILISTSVFYLMYGNVIRQSLAISFFVFSVLRQDRLRYVAFALAFFSHMSVFFLLPVLFIKKNENKMAFLSYLVLLLGSFICFLGSDYIYTILSFVGIESLENKADLYEDFGRTNGDSSIRTLFVSGILLFVLSYVSGKQFVKIDKEYVWLEKIVMVSFFIMVSLVSMDKIFERTFPYFYFVFILYFSYFLVYMKKGKEVYFLIFVFLVFLVYVVCARIGSMQWFYDDNSMLFYTSNLSRVLLDVF